MATRKTILATTGKAEKKRAEILKSAGKCFRKTGFHQTSMQDLCIEIGLGPGAVYRYFAGKEALIAAFAENERRQARNLPPVPEERGLAELLASLTRTCAARYASRGDAGLMAEVYAEGLRNREVGAVIGKVEAQWLEDLRGLLLAAQAKDLIDPALDPAQGALLLTALWDGMVIRQALHPEQHLTDFFGAMALRLLAPSDKRTKPAQNETAARMPEADLRQLSLI